MFLIDGFENEVADNGLLFTPDGQTLISCGGDEMIHLWDIPGRRLRKSLRGHDGFVSGVCLIPGTPLLASGSWDDSVIIWNIETGRKVKTFHLDTGSAISVAASPDGRTLAMVGGEWDCWEDPNRIWRWDVRTWKLMDPLGAFDTQVGIVRYTADGKLILTGDAHRWVIAWDAESGEQRFSLSHTGWVMGLAAHGGLLAVAAGRRVKLWDVPAGARSTHERHVIDGFKGTVISVAFSTDGKLLAVGDKSGCVRLWDVDLGRDRASYRWKIGAVYAVAFAPDGMTVAAGGVGRIAVWDVD